MKELQIIKGVECYIDANGIAQLNLEQVAKGLGFTQTQDKGGKEYTSIRWETINRYCSSFGFPNILGKGDFIPEPIFYLLAMKADNQTAREFQKLVAYDILPSIRKHGLYAKDELLDNPDLFIEILTNLKQERQEKKLLQSQNVQLEQRISEYEPKIQYLDTILQSKGTLTVTQIAADYGMTAYQLNGILQSEKVQHKVGKQWILYKEHLNKSYTKSETIHFEHSDGTPDTTMHTRWRQKGRLMIHNILERRGIKANMDRGM